MSANSSFFSSSFLDVERKNTALGKTSRRPALAHSTARHGQTTSLADVELKGSSGLERSVRVKVTQVWTDLLAASRGNHDQTPEVYTTYFIFVAALRGKCSIQPEVHWRRPPNCQIIINHWNIFWIGLPMLCGKRCPTCFSNNHWTCKNKTTTATRNCVNMLAAI